MGRLVGILVNDPVYRRILYGAGDVALLNQYEEAGAKYGVNPCYLRLKDLKSGGKKVKAILRKQGAYRRVTVKTPTVVYNRAIYRKQPSIDFLARWSTAGGRIVFNACNRYSLPDIRHLLSLDPSLHPHLPIIYPFSPEVLRRMLELYPSVVLEKGSALIHRGYRELVKNEEGEWIFSGMLNPGEDSPQSLLHTEEETLIELYNKYVIRPSVSMVRWDGRPALFYVCVQRNETGKWQLTGLVEKPEEIHTDSEEWKPEENVEKEPFVKHLESKLSANGITLLEEIERVAVAIGEQLSQYLPSLADIGMEIGLKEPDIPVFLRWLPDVGHVFRKTGRIELWAASCHHPIGYASYLLDYLEKREDTDIPHTVSSINRL
ncbi:MULTISPECIES: YheC/YheD family protein [Paenibacillus]|uniref:YheC/YheD family protein n=1 Tax=Paenibacillus residui TaxID=629724 RepID=A0ABW3DBZ5_9BACL|nr:MULTISPECIES: YheC/YheD family protein [Paenibacillaceae]